MTRRQLLQLAVTLPAAGLFDQFRALAAPSLKRVKITGIRAMAIKNIAGNCLIRIDTGDGVLGGPVNSPKVVGTDQHHRDHDEDAVLVKPSELQTILRQAALSVERKAYCLFVPPRLSLLAQLEKRFGWLPLESFSSSGRSQACGDRQTASLLDAKPSESGRVGQR